MDMNADQTAAYHKSVDENIRMYGYHVTFVFSEDAPSFCYSTGVYKSFGIPELFISSLPQNLSHQLVEQYVDRFKNGEPILINEQIDDLNERFPVYLIEADIDQLRAYVLSSIRFYQTDPFQYIQLIYPDTKGLFPGEPGYDYDQVVLGNFYRK